MREELDPAPGAMSNMYPVTEKLVLAQVKPASPPNAPLLLYWIELTGPPGVVGVGAAPPPGVVQSGGLAIVLYGGSSKCDMGMTYSGSIGAFGGGAG